MCEGYVYPVMFTSLDTGEPLTLHFGDIAGAQRMEKGTMVFVRNERPTPSDVPLHCVMVAEDFDHVADLIELKPCQHCGSRECDGKCMASCRAKFENFGNFAGEPFLPKE